jgi:hypothetical protein
MRESLVDRRVVAQDPLASASSRSCPTCCWWASAGSRSSIAASEAILPLVARARHRAQGSTSIVIGVGGGTRVRHTLAIALDLGLPTGGIAQLVGAMEEANAVFLNALLAKHGSIVMQREHFWELPLYLENGMLPIVISIPPYHFWEPPPETARCPRTARTSACSSTPRCSACSASSS